MKKRILSFAMAIVLILALMPGVFATNNPWTSNDAPSQWAQSYVREAYNQNLVPSNLMGRFGQPITRAEFTALGVRLYEEVTGREITGRVTFTDTDDVNVEMMAYLGVVRGVGDNRFNPDGLITRQESAAILSRLSSVIDMPISPNAPTFADNDAISGWARGYVGQMQSSGIMGGVGNNRFDPNGRYTIEQSITTMLRVYDHVEESLNAFLCEFVLNWVRNSGPTAEWWGWDGLDVDFTVGRYVGTFHDQGWIHTYRRLDLAEPHSLDVNSLLFSWHSIHIESQTGDVVLVRAYTDTGGVWWGLKVDLGPSFEAFRRFGLNPADFPHITENYRAYFRASPVRNTDCTCP